MISDDQTFTVCLTSGIQLSSTLFSVDCFSHSSFQEKLEHKLTYASPNPCPSGRQAPQKCRPTTTVISTTASIAPASNSILSAAGSRLLRAANLVRRQPHNELEVQNASRVLRGHFRGDNCDAIVLPSESAADPQGCTGISGGPENGAANLRDFCDSVKLIYSDSCADIHIDIPCVSRP